MNAATMPSGRPVEDFDLAAAVSLARQFVAERKDTQTDNHACRVIGQLLRHMDAAIARADGPLMFDRELVADMLRHPMRHRQSITLMQAALVAGTLGPDTPMSTPTEALERRRPVNPITKDED